MRLFSTAALTLALAATAGLGLSGAALAKDKKKEEAKADAPAKLQASPKFFKVAKPLQDLLGAKNLDGALAMMPEAEANATTEDDKYFVGSFYLAIGVGKQDQALQRKGLDLMLESGKVAADLAPRYEVEAGKLAQIAKDMDAARAHYNKAISLGNTSSDPYLMLAETYFGQAYDHIEGNQLSAEGKTLGQQGLPYLEKAIAAEGAAGKPVPPEWYVRGMKMSVLSGSPDQLKWSEWTVAHAGDSANWRVVLRALQDANPNLSRDENVDVLRLMAVNNALGDSNYSYNEYAEAVNRLGLPGEVVSLIDSGVSKGTIKQESFADLYKLAQASIPKDKASLVESEANAAKAPTGRPAMNTGNAYLGYGNYAKAAEMFRLALQKGSVDTDQVNTRLGIALAKAGDKAGAEAAFAAVTGSPSQLRKAIAELWTIWVQQQG